MKTQGIIFLATEEARRNYKKKEEKSKGKNCPSCEIKTYIPEVTNNNTFEIKEKDN